MEIQAISIENQSQQKELFLKKSEILAKVKHQQDLFKVLKTELFDKKVNKNGKFTGDYEITSRSGNTIFYANVGFRSFFQYRDKENGQKVTFENFNKDGNFELMHIFGDDGSCIIAFDKNDDGIFDIYRVEYKNKACFSFEEK